MFTKAFSFSLFAQDIIYVKSRSELINVDWNSIETSLSLFEKKKKILYLKEGKKVSALS